MKELEIKTEDGTVLVKQTDRGIELHIPKNWRGWKVSKFLAMHEDKIAPLRITIPDSKCEACYKLISDEHRITINPWTLEEPPTKFHNKRKRYAVALTNNVLAGSVHSKANKAAIFSLLKKHGLKLKLENMYLGVWQGTDKNTGKTFTCIDLVKVISDREDAVETGRLRKQEAIHDLDKGVDIYLKDEPFILEI